MFKKLRLSALLYLFASAIAFAAIATSTFANDTPLNHTENDSSHLVKSPSSLSLAALPDIQVCDTDQSGSEAIDLSALIPDILQGYANHSATFYATHLGAENSDIAELIDHTVLFTINTGNTVTFFVRIQDNNDPGVFVVESLNISVGIGVVLIPTDNYIVCVDDTTSVHSFDLTSKENGLIADTTGIIFTYYTSDTDAQNGTIGAIATPENYTNTANPETIYVRAENTDGCFAVASFDLVTVVALSNIATPQALVSGCFLNPDGTATFNLTSKNTEILNGEVATITYHPTLADANANTAIINPANNYQGLAGSVYARVTHASGCHVIKELELLFGNTIIANQVVPITLPDTNGNGFNQFNLGNVINQATAGNTELVNVSFHLTQQNAINDLAPIPLAYVNVEPYFQTLYIRVESQANPDCYATVPLYLIVKYTPLSGNLSVNVTSESDNQDPNATNLTFISCEKKDANGIVLPFEASLEASFRQSNNTNQYVVESIDYAPPFPFVGGTGEFIPLTVDDAWSHQVFLGFDFCFFEGGYKDVLIATNGAITFSIGGPNGNGGIYAPNSPSQWQYNQQIPGAGAGTGPPYRNAIFGVMQDLYPTLSPPNHSVNYQLIGTYPNRTLVFNIYEMGLFSCGQNVGTQTSQIVLYESTNVIDVYIEKRTPCTTFNSGSGLVGIQNQEATIAYTPPGRNTGAWSAFQEAWRFEPSGTSQVEFGWYKDGILISEDLTLDLSVTETSIYIAQARYKSCSGDPDDDFIAKYPVYIQIDAEVPAGQPDDQTRCEDENDNTFDLTELLPQIYGDDLDPNDVDVSFYLDMDYLEAEWPIEWGTFDNDFSNIDIEAFEVTGSQDIYVKIVDIEGENPCYALRQFTLSIVNCDVTAPEDIALCDQDEDGSESVDLAALIADIAPGIDDATITFHSTQSGANDGTTDIIDHNIPYAVTTGTTVTVYIRVLDNDTGFDYTELFNISINQIPQILQTVSDYELCLVNPSGEADFDLTSKTTEILDLRTAGAGCPASPASWWWVSSPVRMCWASSVRSAWRNRASWWMWRSHSSCTGSGCPSTPNASNKTAKWYWCLWPRAH